MGVLTQPQAGLSSDPFCSKPLAYRCPRLISHLNQQLVPAELTCLGQPSHLAARYHCRCLLYSVLALEEAFDLDLLVARLEEDVSLLSKCTQQTAKKRFRGESPKHEQYRKNTRIVGRIGVELAAAVAAAVVAAGGRSMVDPVAGKALTDKKSQKKQVKQGQAQWGLDIRTHHPSHDDQKGPAGDPGRECVRRILLEVQVGEVQAGKTRPNGDV